MKRCVWILKEVTRYNEHPYVQMDLILDVYANHLDALKVKKKLEEKYKDYPETSFAVIGYHLIESGEQSNHCW